MELRKKIEPKKSSDRGDRSQPFDAVGEYVCRVKAFREQPENDQYAQMFFIDLEVVSGPTAVGELKYYCMNFNPNKYTTTKMDDGRQFTGKQKRAKDEESLQVNFAACLGLDAEDAGQLADSYDSIEAAFADSSKVGGLVNVTVRSTTAKRGPHAGKQFFNPELSPYRGPAIGSVPAVPAAPTTVLPDGWTQHPGDVRYAFKGSDVKLISELV